MTPVEYYLKDDGKFPNSDFPVIVYKNAIELPAVFKSLFAKNFLRRHRWSNNWRNGIFTYHHYHSNTHEVMAAIKGKTTLLVGGEKGTRLKIEKGDVIVIPAGVAHKNLGKEKDIICIGGYPAGRDYDIKYGLENERPEADERIAKVTMPFSDPVTGKRDPLWRIWKNKV